MVYALNVERLSLNENRLQRHTDQSAANTQLTLTAPKDGAPRRVDKVTVRYTDAGVDAPVSVDVTVTLDSGVGGVFDSLLQTISLAANAHGVFIPDEDMWVSGDDVIVVVAPAGGAGVISAVAIYLEEAGR